LSKKSFLASQWFQKDIDSVHESTKSFFDQYSTNSVSFPSEKPHFADQAKIKIKHHRFPKFIYQNKTPKLSPV
jgi:hypothetical protein